MHILFNVKCMKLEILLAMALYKIVENYFKAANAHI